MNRNRFRIIFNELRGLFMAVAEHVRSHAAQTSAISGTDNSVTENNHNAAVTMMRPVAFSVMLMLGMVIVLPNPVNIGQANADIHADPTAPKNQQPIILSAPNGVEVVNIRTPSAAGVSRNTYSQFDVPRQGAIINNSRSNVQSQLGGWLQGNPFLAAGTARVIFNEVNSNNPSYLNGYIEIAGSRAEFILANPNGITCNGCGFINAYRPVLTTGTPIFNGGDLAGYRVHGGDINIIGDGLDASNSNYTDIIARTVNVHAGIWAGTLKIKSVLNGFNNLPHLLLRHYLLSKYLHRQEVPNQIFW